MSGFVCVFMCYELWQMAVCLSVSERHRATISHSLLLLSLPLIYINIYINIYIFYFIFLFG